MVNFKAGFWRKCKGRWEDFQGRWYYDFFQSTKRKIKKCLTFIYIVMSAFYTFLSSLYNCLFKIYFVNNIIRGDAKVLRGGAENLWCKVVPREVCTSKHLPPKAGLDKLCEIRPVN